MRDLLLIDFDGVIADSLEATCTATIDVLKSHGFAHMACRRSMLALFDGNYFKGLEGAGVPPVVIEAIDDRFADIASTGAVKPFREMPAVITRLADHNRIVVITSNRTDIVQGLLSSWGISGISDVLGGDREESKVRKIESVLLGYEDDDRCWLVGDTVGDILEGR